MQFISSLTAALALAAIAVGASLDKPVASVARAALAPGLTVFHDFQGKSLNLVSDDAREGTAVIVFPIAFDGAINQQWALDAVGDSGNFTIANGANTDFQLTYPAAPFGGDSLFAPLVVSSTSPATFSLQDTGSDGGVFIIEVTSGQALTSWAGVAAQAQAPVTLNALIPGLQTQQTWILVEAPA